MKCRPSGRKAGQRWKDAAVAGAVPVAVLGCPIAGDGVPPADGMRNKGVLGAGVNRIVPSDPQAPPRGWGASARVCTAPPLASMILSFPWAKNPRLRLSGDQNGELASSVPANGCAAVESRGRTHSWGANPAMVATNASLVPSGEMAVLIGSKECCSG